MPLTEYEKLLVDGLKIFGCNRLEILYIGVHLYTEEKQIKMMDWMCEHPEATPEQLMKLAAQISPPEDFEDYEDENEEVED